MQQSLGTTDPVSKAYFWEFKKKILFWLSISDVYFVAPCERGKIKNLIFISLGQEKMLDWNIDTGL